jgi:hypothetical protein
VTPTKVADPVSGWSLKSTPTKQWGGPWKSLQQFVKPIRTLDCDELGAFELIAGQFRIAE